MPINHATEEASNNTIPESDPEVRWSKRHTPTQCLRESLEQGLLGFQATFDSHDGQEEWLIQKDMAQPLAFAANKSDPDTMYMHQAMQQPDKKKFKQGMMEEIKAHTKNKHWEVIERAEVPEGDKILLSVWAMKRKRRIATGEVYKWKARLDLPRESKNMESITGSPIWPH